MSVNNERIIELSKVKLAALIAGAVLMAAAGAFFLAAGNDSSFILEARRFGGVGMVRLIGILAVVFFGGCAAYGGFKLFDKKPGLVLNSQGMVDNASGVEAGFIPWADVTDVSIFAMNRQRMLVVHVADPARYIRGNAVQRALRRANAGMCGSPIVISAHTLRIPFEELRAEVASYLARYGPAGSGLAGPG